MSVWEYHTFSFSPSVSFLRAGKLDEQRLQRELDRRGEKGWELVGIFSSATGQDRINEVAVVFKRQKSTA
jgi:hypothetical protein